ncbi:MAG: hypothetical protein JWQ02_4105 [Capsulimonas sp.]|jgi:hypothetical protein|nr:hypothetical protein [Capsulimonas sp.]
MKRQIIRRNGILAAAVTVGLLLAGSGGGSPSAAATGTSATGSAPSLSERKAVSDAATVVNYSAATLSTLGELIGAPNTSGIWRGSATHPTITVSRTTASTTVTVDYGTGITGPGGVTRSGAVIITIDKTGKTGSVTFSGYAVNGSAVTGSVQLTSLTFSGGVVSFSTSTNLTIGGFGTIAGAQSAMYGSQTLTLSSANLQIHKTSGDQYAAAISNVAISYTANGAFLPYSGSVTVSAKPVSGSPETIAVAFITATPSTKVVYVSINGGKAFPYVLGSSRQ